MPGMLRPDAECPKCGTDLLAIVDTTNAAGVVREYHHQKSSPKCHRKPFCKRKFSNYDEAQAERDSLEVDFRQNYRPI